MTLFKRDVSVSLFSSRMTQHEVEVSQTTRKDPKNLWRDKKKVTVWDKYMPEMLYRHYETLLLQFISGLYLTVLLVAQPLCWLIGFTLFTLLQTQKACVFFEDEETTICQVIYSFTKHMLHKVCTGKVSFPASETLLVAFHFVWSKSVKCQTWWIITTLRLTLIEK